MKKLLGLIGMIGLTFLLGACGANDNTSNTTETSQSANGNEPVTLILGVMPATDNIPLIIAHEKGFDVKHGVKLDLQTFRSAQERDAAFAAGAIDGLSTDLVGVAISRNSGSDLMITSTTFGTFNLITGNDSVQTVADLKGKDVIVSKNTGAEYAIAMMLKDAGLSMDDINILEVAAVPARLEALKNGQAAAAILPEPFATMAQAEGLRMLSSTEKIGINPFVMAFPKATIEQKAVAIRGMYEAYNEAVAYIQSHDKADFIQFFIDDVGFPETLKDQIQVPAYTKATQASDADIQSAFTWAKSAGLLEKELTPQDVLSDVFFR